MLLAPNLWRKIAAFATHAAPPMPCEVVVVLGAKVLPGGRLSLALERRVQHGVALLQAGVGQRLLMSGGSVDGSPVEAEVMLARALALGVDANRVLLEPESRSTIENAQRSAVVLRALGVTEIVLVSDHLHLLRATTLFRLEGLRVHPSGSGLPPEGWPTWSSRSRELAALLRDPKLGRAALET